jgi:hypothetical protein
MIVHISFEAMGNRRNCASIVEVGSETSLSSGIAAVSEALNKKVQVLTILSTEDRCAG